MKHWWEDQHEQAVFCCNYLSCTLRGSAPAKRARCNNATVSYVVKSVYIAGDDSPRRLGLPDTTPNISPSISLVISEQPLSSALGKSRCAKHLRKTSFMFMSALYHFELLMTNDVLKRNHISILDNEEH